MASIHEIANFLWDVADEVLCDDFKRGKYPDVILPFVVLRRLDCVLAPTKEKVLKKATDLKKAGIQNVDGQLRQASKCAFFNTSKYDFDKLSDDSKNIAKNPINYINGFSENVRDILLVGCDEMLHAAQNRVDHLLHAAGEWRSFPPAGVAFDT